MNVRDGITIDAPIEQVWEVFADVQRWPEWTESVTSVTALDGAGLHVDAVFRIKQPRLPTLDWRVTAVEPGTGWTWVSTAPGASTSAIHELYRLGPSTTRVEQIIDQRGAIGRVVGRLTRRLTRRYLAMEAAGLSARVRGLAATP